MPSRRIRSTLLWTSALALLLASAASPPAAFVEPEARALAALRSSSSVPVDARFEGVFPRSPSFEVIGPAGETPTQVAPSFLSQGKDLFSQDHSDLALLPVAAEADESDVVSFLQT